MSDMRIEPPSSDKKYGFVTGRIVRRLTDSDDADPYLDTMPVTGKVIFTPYERIGRGTDYNAIIVRETVTAQLDSMGSVGTLVDGTRGIYLTVGHWSVSFVLDIDTRLESFVIDVEESHTTSAPLDLLTAMSFQPASVPRSVYLSLPSGGKVDDTLVMQPDGTLAWQHYILAGVTLEDLRGPQGIQGIQGPSGPSGGVLSENMLANGLFELGTMQYMNNGTIVETDLPVDNGVPFKISYPLGAKSPSPAYPPVPITGSETYMIEYWVKASKPNAWIYMSIRDENLGFLQASDTIWGPEHPNLLAETDRVPTTWQRKVVYIRRTTSSSPTNRAAKYLNFRYFTLNSTPNSSLPDQPLATDADFEFGGIRIRPVFDPIMPLYKQPNPVVGSYIYDSTLKKIIIFDGSVWRDAMGTAI